MNCPTCSKPLRSCGECRGVRYFVCPDQHHRRLVDGRPLEPLQKRGGSRAGTRKGAEHHVLTAKGEPTRCLGVDCGKTFLSPDRKRVRFCPRCRKKREGGRSAARSQWAGYS